ncbi:MAG: glycosyl hydrolase 53 family protein [Bacilli bacterium]|nr:glycosyl hydrolase 53 family protein [Bacilli bacterium]
MKLKVLMVTLLAISLTACGGKKTSESSSSGESIPASEESLPASEESIPIEESSEEESLVPSEEESLPVESEEESILPSEEESILPSEEESVMESIEESEPVSEEESEDYSGKVQSDTLYAKKVLRVDDDEFVLGMDVSSVLAEEASGVKYYDFEGNEEDLLKVLADNGVNYIRVRVWNNPYDDEGHGFGGGNNDINAAVAIGKRATSYGMKLLVDFHYSDFWADPGKQKAPRAWEDCEDIDDKAARLYEFTKESLNTLKDEGVVVGMVQVGNETNRGYMAGETSWFNYAKLFIKGSKAVREVYPEAKVACHFTNPENNGAMLDYASKLKYYGLDYDVFGTSWYPYWHGTLDNLSTTLSTIAETYNKQVMVMETSYAYSYEDSDFGGNTSPNGGDVKPYPITVAGQANHVNILADTIKNHTTNGIGICYWEGAWITVGDNWESNSAKWEEFGSGWAASYASIYDKDVALYGPGGSQVENQAFFDPEGKPLESLKIWNLMRYGNDVETYVDGVEDVSLIHYTTDDFTLPETVNAIFSDNSRRPIPVTWEEFDVEAAKAAGNGKYDIEGSADVGGGKTYEVHLFLSIMEKNYLENYSFEDGDYVKAGELTSDPWVITNRSTKDFSATYVVKVTNENPSEGGEYNLNFWAQDANVLNFDIEQEVTSEELLTGEYKFQISLMGAAGSAQADKSLQNMYAYVKIDDEIVAQQTAYVTSYKVWEDFVVTGVNYTVGQKLTVGVHIESSIKGIWGSLEDCMLNYVQA